jgi:precorrin-6Y C5,15-methyltransferase (decarboxylating)
VARFSCTTSQGADRNFPQRHRSVQYAFAQIRSRDDAIFVSVHGRGLKTAIDRIVAAEKVAILTDEVNPGGHSEELIARGAEGYEAWLCEDPGLPTEKFTRPT